MTDALDNDSEASEAIIANKKNRDNLASKMIQIEENNERKIREANEIKSKLEGKDIIIQMEANEDGNLYGNVGPKQITDNLKKDHSIDLDPANILLGNVKELRDYTVIIRLYD